MLIPFDHLWQKYQIKSKDVLHLGAHFGEEGCTYHRCGVERVIWVEALPSAYRTLVKRIDPDDKALLACVGDKDGERVSFKIASNEGQSSSILDFGTHMREHPTVKFTGRIDMKTVRVDTLLESYSIRIAPGAFLNIDLQGAELLALKGMGNQIVHFDYAYIEVNRAELYKGCPMVEEIDAFLEPFGFERAETKWTGNGWGDALYVKR